MAETTASLAVMKGKFNSDITCQENFPKNELQEKKKSCNIQGL